MKVVLTIVIIAILIACNFKNQTPIDTKIEKMSYTAPSFPFLTNWKLFDNRKKLSIIYWPSYDQPKQVMTMVQVSEDTFQIMLFDSIVISDCTLHRIERKIEEQIIPNICRSRLAVVNFEKLVEKLKTHAKSNPIEHRIHPNIHQLHYFDHEKPKHIEFDGQSHFLNSIFKNLDSLNSF